MIDHQLKVHKSTVTKHNMSFLLTNLVSFIDFLPEIKVTRVSKFELLHIMDYMSNNSLQLFDLLYYL